jgi:phage shock protein A
MGLGRSIKRFFRSIVALFTGNIDSASDGLDQNPNVIKAKYEGIIQDKLKNIHQYKEAVAGLITQEERKMRQIGQLTGDIERLEKLKTGAAAKAKQVVADLKTNGVSQDDIHKDENYLRCSSAFKDFSNTLAEKQVRVDELEIDVVGYSKSIKDHKLQLTELKRNIEGLRNEAHETVAQVITAKQEKELSDMITGISTDGTSEELDRLRNLRDKAKASARISKEMAGTDTASQEADFLEYAKRDVSNSEFDILIGLEDDAAASESPEAAPAEDEGKLPE